MTCWSGTVLAVLLLYCCLSQHTSLLCSARLYQGTPPRGWNSYDAFTCTVTEAEVKANADIMHDELAKYGYEYVTIDYEWFRPGTGQFSCCGRNPWQDLVVDKYGRALPSPDRYPSAKDSTDTGLPGFKPLADFVHGLDQKFGIHIMRGIPRVAVEKNMPIFGSSYTARDAADNKTYCSWCDDMSGIADNAAGQAYYDSLIKLYAEWGVDFIKMDCAYSSATKSEILQISKSIQESEREFVLSMSPTDRDTSFAMEIRGNVSMYRVNGDVWDNWGNIESAFSTAATFPTLIGNPSYPDLDMLPLGKLSVRGGHGPERVTALTEVEQRTMMNLWGMFRNPLVMGGDLRSLDDATTALLTNEELLKVQSSSTNNRPITSTAFRVVSEQAIQEVINVEKCRVPTDPHQQWGHVSATTDGSLPNHATFGCLTLINCSFVKNATLGAERCHVGSGCDDGVNQVWEVGRDGYIDTPMNQAVLTTTSATSLPCNVTAMAKDSNLTKLQLWMRNETDNTLHHLATGGCLTSTLIGGPEVLGNDEVSAVAWAANLDSMVYVGLFNLDAQDTAKVSVKFADIGIRASMCELRNIWSKEVLHTQTEISDYVAPHGSVVYAIDPASC
ncbi:uncharacterized protein LOC135822735 [Sycon ciliatum]|uniref:uncharacterized protein LOC135822735 n=1 Tax=Sycon ciliatum TaxID=27933 RepID=UPI0031F6B1C7